MVETIAVDKLVPAPDNPRRNVGDVSELAASITAQGLLQPLVVSPRGDGTYMVVAGHRRLAAAALAGIGELECSVREMDDVARNEAMVTENIARCALTALEEAAAYRRLIDLGVSQRKLAPKLGCSQSHVSKRLALLGLPSSVQSEIDSGGITVGDGVELAKLADPATVEAARQNSRRFGRTMAEAVKEQQRAIKAAEARRKAFEGLRAEGVKIVADPPRYGWYDRKEKPLGKSYGHVDVARARHAKERCHAAAVDAEGGIVYVCVNPRRHAKDDDAQSAATKEAEVKKRAERKALREAAAARSEVITGLLSRRVAKGEQWSFVMRQMVAAARSGPASTACRFLGLEPVCPHEGSPYKDWGATLAGYVAGGDEALARATLALGFAYAEDVMNAEWNTWAAAEVTNHLGFLGRVGGYRLSTAERQKLGDLALDGYEDDPSIPGEAS